MRDLGLAPGDTAMAHASLRRVGRIIGGPDALIQAILEATAPGGTLMAYTDWNGDFDNFWGEDGAVPEELRSELQPFDAASSRAIRDNGSLAEFVRTFPGARRSASSGASCAAIGERADWLTAGHSLNYGYGQHSPFARLVEAQGKVLMLGAPLDTMTLLHHAEHLADIPGKRLRRYEVPFLEEGRTVWRWIEEFETSDPVVEGLADDYFASVVEEFLASGEGSRGIVGSAPSVLVDAQRIVAHAIDWLESRFRAKA